MRASVGWPASLMSLYRQKPKNLSLSLSLHTHTHTHTHTQTHILLRFSEEAALVYASFGPNVMVWQAFSSPSSCSPTTPLHSCFPPYSSPFSPLPPSFLELMGLKAFSSSLLKHAFNLIIYYLLFFLPYRARRK